MNWRLPTKEELDLMYENLHEKGIGNFKEGYYWRSSEGTVDDVWKQYHYGKPKSRHRVRAVRDFEYFEYSVGFEIGERTETGIIFSKDGNKYFECAFEDLKVGEKEIFTWDEAMDYLKRSSGELTAEEMEILTDCRVYKNDKEKVEKEETEFLLNCLNEKTEVDNIEKDATLFDIKQFYDNKGVLTEVNVKVKVDYQRKEYEVLTGKFEEKFCFDSAKVNRGKRKAIALAIALACELGERELEKAKKWKHIKLD
jgi:hypothetical protein